MVHESIWLDYCQNIQEISCSVILWFYDPWMSHLTRRKMGSVQPIQEVDSVNGFLCMSFFCSRHFLSAIHDWMPEISWKEISNIIWRGQFLYLVPAKVIWIDQLLSNAQKFLARTPNTFNPSFDHVLSFFIQDPCVWDENLCFPLGFEGSCFSESWNSFLSYWMIPLWGNF